MIRLKWACVMHGAGWRCTPYRESLVFFLSRRKKLRMFLLFPVPNHPDCYFVLREDD